MIPDRKRVRTHATKVAPGTGAAGSVTALLITFEDAQPAQAVIRLRHAVLNDTMRIFVDENRPAAVDIRYGTPVPKEDMKAVSAEEVQRNPKHEFWEFAEDIHKLASEKIDEILIAQGGHILREMTPRELSEPIAAAIVRSRAIGGYEFATSK